MKMKKKYNVVIVGAGVAGAAAARELSKYDLKIAIIEKEADVCFGATKGTHGIVHCGIPGKGSPLKNRGELMGNLMMEQVCSELDVPFCRTGKLLVAFDDKEISVLKAIEISAKRNGVSGIRMITDRGELKEMEPNISDDLCAALHTPSTAVASPWELVFGFVENAVDNGADLYTNTVLMGIDKQDDGFVLETDKGEIHSRYVINAAGKYADEIAAMVGDTSFKIEGSRQQRIIVDKKCEGLVKHVVRSVSGGSPGNFIMPTVYGDVMIGSKVDSVEDVTDARTTREGIEGWIIPQCKKMIPAFLPSTVIKPFAGFIPMAGGEYHIKPAPNAPCFINLVLGGSGFTASIAMARYVAEEVLTSVGMELREKEDYNPYRKGIPRISELSNEERADLIGKDPNYGHIVCRCENVSEGEIVEAIRRGATTRDGVKFRTRAGMGRCQGGFCGPRVLKILSRELNLPVTKITRKGFGSEEVLYNIKELL